MAGQQSDSLQAVLAGCSSAEGHSPQYGRPWEALTGVGARQASTKHATLGSDRSSGRGDDSGVMAAAFAAAAAVAPASPAGAEASAALPVVPLAAFLGSSSSGDAASSTSCAGLACIVPRWSCVALPAGSCLLQPPSASSLSSSLALPRKLRPRIFKKDACMADGCHVDLAPLAHHLRRNHICQARAGKAASLVASLPCMLSATVTAVLYK